MLELLFSVFKLHCTLNSLQTGGKKNKTCVHFYSFMNKICLVPTLVQLIKSLNMTPLIINPNFFRFDFTLGQQSYCWFLRVTLVQIPRRCCEKLQFRRVSKDSLILHPSTVPRQQHNNEQHLCKHWSIHSYSRAFTHGNVLLEIKRVWMGR